MKCAVLQPSYIPWRGYFHQIQMADTFVFYDDVQYDKHGWRNRNRIKTSQGTQWLSIPVLAGGSVAQGTPINQISIDNRGNWAAKHWKSLQQSYAKAPHFRRYAPMLEEFYARPAGQLPHSLADFTIELTTALARALGNEKTLFLRSSSLQAGGSKMDRLLEVLRAVGATHYISGPSARAYMEEDKLREAGISLEYMAYNYPEYPQLYPPFDPQVSILDLLFALGPEAPSYIWGAHGAD